MALELRQLRQVLALAEHGSFARASAALHISQPALSRSIQDLEHHVGAALFTRRSSGVEPTDIGRLYIERSRGLVRMADALNHELLPSGPVGRVIVGGGPYPAESILGPAAARFASRFPKVTFELRVRNWDDLLRQLRACDVDFFVAEVSTLEHDPDLAIELLAEHRLYWVARAGHPLAARGNFTTADIFAWPVVAPTRIPPRLLEKMLGAQRDAADGLATVRALPAIECNALATVKRIIEESDAITALPLTSVAVDLEAGRWVVLGAEPWLHLRFGLVRLKGRQLTLAAEAARAVVLAVEREVHADATKLDERWGSGASARASAARGDSDLGEPALEAGRRRRSRPDVGSIQSRAGSR